MKTIITVTNCTDKIEDYMKQFSIEELPFEEIVRSRERDGIFFMKEILLSEKIDSINVINLFITEDEGNPLYDISLDEEQAKELIVNVFSAKDLPYCELTADLFKKQKIQVNDCEHCFVKCDRRMQPYERNQGIDAIFEAWCREIYETHKNDFKQARVALAMHWPLEIDVETFSQCAMNKEDLFEEFLDDEFNVFVIMAPLIQRRCPQYLQYYFQIRKLPLREFLVDKFTMPW